MPDPRLPHALAYAANGWPVFVLGRSKRPLANCRACTTAPPGHDRQACACLTCHGFYAASTDPDRITAVLAAVPRGLLAVRTGAAAGLLVIDIDPRHGGRLNPDLMPPTACVATAGGGWHLYYRHPGGTVLSRGLPGVAGVDVKADGGYVVAPPSAPRGGGGYRWTDRTAVNEMAPPLVDLCRTMPADPPPSPPEATAGPAVQRLPRARGAGAISSPDALLAAILHAVHTAPKGRHRVTLYGAARGVARMVAAGALTPEAAVAVLTDTGQAVAQTRREIHGAIVGGFTAEGVPVPSTARKAG